MFTVMTLNTFLQGLPSHHLLRQAIVEQSEVEIVAK